MVALRLFFCLFLLSLPAARDQTALVLPADTMRPLAPLPALAASPAPPAPARLPVRVLDVYALSSHRHDTLQLGDHVVLQVLGLREALQRYQRKPTELRLFISGVALPMKPEEVDTLRDRDTATVRFLLKRDVTTEPTWQLFYQVWQRLDYAAQFGVGFDNGQLGEAYPRHSQTIYLELVRRRDLIIGLLAVGGILGLLLYLGIRSNLLRSDTVRGELDAETLAASDLISDNYRTIPFSLAKVQLGFWTFLIISAYLLCYMVTGELPDLPASLLGLLGISLGSNVLSRSITAGQVQSSGPLTVNSASLGFWRDILAEQSRFSLPRIQFFLFNLLVGFYFVRYVWKLWAMPDLDANLIALISVSAGGFLAGKAQENGAPLNATPAPDPAPTPDPTPTPKPTTLTTPTTTTTVATTGAAVTDDGTPTARADAGDNAAGPGARAS